MELLYWGLGLLGLSVLFFLLEVILPTAGALAISALVAAIAGVVCLFRYDTLWGLIATLVMVVLIPAGILFAMRVWPHTPLGRRIIGIRDDEATGETSTVAQEPDQRLALMGEEALVVTDLRPIGVVEVGGKRYDARSETKFCPAGSRVKVTAIERNELRVRP